MNTTYDFAIALSPRLRSKSFAGHSRKYEGAGANAVFKRRISPAGLKATEVFIENVGQLFSMVSKCDLYRLIIFYKFDIDCFSRFCKPSYKYLKNLQFRFAHLRKQGWWRPQNAKKSGLGQRASKFPKFLQKT